MKIDVLERAPARVARLRYTGPFGEPLGRFWRVTVTAWLAEHGLLDCPRYGIARDDPRFKQPESCRYDACVEPPGGLSVPGAEEIEVAGGRYAVLFFKGRAAEIGAAWDAFAWECRARSLAPDPSRPPLEHYPRGATFDARTGVFACELCLPLASPPVYALAHAAAADAAEILALQKLAYRSEAQLYDDWSLPPLVQTLESLREELAQSIALVARADGALVGSVRARIAGDTAHIGRLIVHPDWQGRGIGTALLRAVERECGQTRRFELFTGSRSEGNIRLYERLGYVRSREKTLSPAVTLVYLEKLR